MGTLQPLFPTVMVTRRLDHLGSLNDRLKTMILARDAGCTGARPVAWDDCEMAGLRQEILSVGSVLAQSVDPSVANSVDLAGRPWAALQRSGELGRTHDHVDGGWVGYYFVCIGESAPAPDFSGKLDFDDPRPGNLPINAGSSVTPEAGLAILFPRSLAHRINPFFGAGERVYVGFDLDLGETFSP